MMEVTGDKDERSCIYPDFTQATKNPIPEQNCATLLPGTCAINCPCDNTGRSGIGGYYEKNAELYCQFLSEAHPIGICGTETCEGDDLGSGCVETGSTCAEPILPEWVKTFRANRTGGFHRHVSAAGDLGPGTCVQKSVCDAWSAQNPGVTTCGEAMPEVDGL